MTATATSLLGAFPPRYREQLRERAREVGFPESARLFEEGDRADRFWVVRTGAVTLDMRVPGRQRAVVETLRPGDMVGWSWLVPPYTWHLGAEAMSPVRALEFDAESIRAMARSDPEFGRLLGCRVAEIIGHRLQQARMHLLDLYGPRGSGQWS
jgi:CRP-like cAMP-binding protein